MSSRQALTERVTRRYLSASASGIPKNYPHVLVELSHGDLWSITRYDTADGLGKEISSPEAGNLLLHRRYWLYVWDADHQKYTATSRPNRSFETWTDLTDPLTPTGPLPQWAQMRVVGGKKAAIGKGFEALGVAYHSLKDILDDKAVSKSLPPKILSRLTMLSDDVYKEWRKMAPGALTIKDGSSDTLKVMVTRFRAEMEKATIGAYEAILPYATGWAHLVATYLVRYDVFTVNTHKAELQLNSPAFAAVEGTINIKDFDPLDIKFVFNHKPGVDAWWVDVTVNYKGTLMSSVAPAYHAGNTATNIVADLKGKDFLK